MHEEDIPKIKTLIEEIKLPFTNYGGDVEFLDIQDDKVRVRAAGYCHT